MYWLFQCGELGLISSNQRIDHKNLFIIYLEHYKVFILWKESFRISLLHDFLF